jgi:hypothetical protein
MAMPLGLRRLELARPGSIPYAWGINGIASVLASVLGVTIAMLYGFEVTGLVAAGCYGAALVLVLATSPEARAEGGPLSATETSRFPGRG